MEDKILDSRYKIISSLGKGGFGKTYLAEDTKRPANPQCVVKQLNPGIEDEKFLELARRLFQKEAEILEKLGFNEQIPRLLANFEQENEFYLVQEYIEGQTIGEELIPDSPWSEEKVIDFLNDCLQIIDFVHNNGVIHRDIKPDNLIRRAEDGKLVLVDFGTVKEVVISQTQAIASTVAVGTRGYMPTEQARGKPRFTSDIYALGIIAIQALTGVHPIQLQEDDNGEVIWQSLAQCSDKLKAIVSKMVRYHFKDRYQSAPEVLASLSEFNVNPAIPVTEPVRYTPTEKITVSTNSQTNLASENSGNQSDRPVRDNSEPVIPTAPDKLDSRINSQSAARNSEVQSSNVSDINPSNINVSSQSAPPPEKTEQTNSTSKVSDFVKSSTGKTVGVALIFGAIATGAMYFLGNSSAEKQAAIASTRIQEIQDFYTAKNYERCSELATSKETKELGLTQSEINKWVGECELGKAQREADIDEYENAINIAIKVAENDFPNHEQVKQKIDLWSEEVLKQATKAYTENGDLQEAKRMIVKVIPQSSRIKNQALDLKAQWEQEQQTIQPIIEEAEKALQQKRWEKAKIEADKIGDNASEYWQQQAREIAEEANKEIQSAQKQTQPKSNSNTVTPQRTTSTNSASTNVTPRKTTPSNTTTNKSVPPSSKTPAVIDVCQDASLLCN